MTKKLLILASAAFVCALSSNAQAVEHQLKNSVKTEVLQRNVLDKAEKDKVQATATLKAPRRSYATQMYYARPKGTFYSAFSASNGNDYCYLVFPNFTNVVYQNKTAAANRENCVWSYNETAVPGDEDNNLPEIYAVPSGRLYLTPTLSLDGEEFNIGDGHNFAQVGVISTDSITEFMKWDIVQGRNYSGYSDGTYCFGSVTRNFDFDGDGEAENVICDQVLELFDKPARPLYLTSVLVPATSNSPNYEDMLKNGATLEVGVYPIEYDEEGDWLLGEEALATMTLSLDEIIVSGTYSSGDGSYAYFEVAPTTVDAWGVVSVEPLLLDQPFAISISGFANPDVDMGLRMGDAAEARYDFEDMAPTFHTYYSPEDGTYKGMLRSYGSDEQGPWCYNVVLYLNGMFDVADVEEDYANLVAPEAGGIFETVAEFEDDEGNIVHDPVVVVYTQLPWVSTWEENAGEDNYYIITDNEDEDFPEWVKWTGFSDNYFETSLFNLLQFTADPLPDGVAGRQARIRVVSDKGADSGVITLTQGNYESSIKSVTGTAGKANSKVYNLAGQQVTGNFQGIMVKNGKKVIKN